MKTRIDLDQITRRAIAAHLQTAPGDDERAFIALVREQHQARFSRAWDEADDDLARELFAEIKLGIDRDWTAPTADLYQGDQEWAALAVAG